MSLRDELQAIYDQHGELTPELVVETARPRSHPLHGSVFDRPVREAAEAYYRDRAHGLIQKVRIVYRDPEDDEPRSVRAWQAVQRPEGYRYEPAEKVAMDPEAREIVLRDMAREWRTLKARYEDFAEFAEMVQGDLAGAAGPG